MLCENCKKPITNTRRLEGMYHLPKVDLDLLHVVVDIEGRIIQGFVDNGSWTLKRNGDEWQALDYGGVVRNRWAYEEYEYTQIIPNRLDEEDYEDDIPF